MLYVPGSCDRCKSRSRNIAPRTEGSGWTARAIRVHCDPLPKLALEIGRYGDYGDKVVFHGQHQNLGWPKAADGENPQNQVLSRRCVREQGANFTQGQKTFARFLLDLRHCEFPNGAFLDQVLIGSVLKAGQR
jgi:hypothetical protein